MDFFLPVRLEIMSLEYSPHLYVDAGVLDGNAVLRLFFFSLGRYSYNGRLPLRRVSIWRGYDVLNWLNDGDGYLLGNLCFLLGATVIRRVESPSSGSTYGRVSGDLRILSSKWPRFDYTTGLLNPLITYEALSLSYTALTNISSCVVWILCPPCCYLTLVHFWIYYFNPN
jgi:hypothetical protein